MQHLPAERRVRDLGMKLHAVQPSFCIGKGRAGTAVGLRRHRKARRRRLNKVPMAHPADAFCGNAAEEDVVPNMQRGLAVFAAVFRLADFPARQKRHKLCAVADAENGNAEAEQCRSQSGAPSA